MFRDCSAPFAALDKRLKTRANASMSLHAKYPALSDLRARAQARVPRFVWEYLDSGTGSEATKTRNRIMLDRVRLSPSILHGEFEPDISATLLGRTHDLPVGSRRWDVGLIWPDTERHLARAATAAGIPYTLSTVASRTPRKWGRIWMAMAGSRCIRPVTPRSAPTCWPAPAMPGFGCWC